MNNKGENKVRLPHDEHLKRILNTPWKGIYSWTPTAFIFRKTKKGELQILMRPFMAKKRQNKTNTSRFTDITKRSWGIKVSNYISNTIHAMSQDQIPNQYDNIAPAVLAPVPFSGNNTVYNTKYRRPVKPQSPSGPPTTKRPANVGGINVQAQAQWDNLENVNKLICKELNKKIKELMK
jgi:hypothetical protein